MRKTAICGFPSENHLQMVDEFNIELLVYLMVKTHSFL